MWQAELKRSRERANHALVIYTKTGEYCADFYLKRGGGEEEGGEEERERERERELIMISSRGTEIIFASLLV